MSEGLCVFWACIRKDRETTMKAILAVFALAYGLAFTLPAFAQTGDVSQQKTREDCDKVWGYWDSDTMKCNAKPQAKPQH
jgi:hypothetical protein